MEGEAKKKDFWDYYKEFHKNVADMTKLHSNDVRVHQQVDETLKKHFAFAKLNQLKNLLGGNKGGGEMGR